MRVHALLLHLAGLVGVAGIVGCMLLEAAFKAPSTTGGQRRGPAVRRASGTINAAQLGGAGAGASLLPVHDETVQSMAEGAGTGAEQSTRRRGKKALRSLVIVAFCVYAAWIEVALAGGQIHEAVRPSIRSDTGYHTLYSSFWLIRTSGVLIAAALVLHVLGLVHRRAAGLMVGVQIAKLAAVMPTYNHGPGVANCASIVGGNTSIGWLDGLLGLNACEREYPFVLLALCAMVLTPILLRFADQSIASTPMAGLDRRWNRRRSSVGLTSIPTAGVAAHMGDGAAPTNVDHGMNAPGTAPWAVDVALGLILLLGRGTLIHYGCISMGILPVTSDEVSLYSRTGGTWLSMPGAWGMPSFMPQFATLATGALSSKVLRVVLQGLVYMLNWTGFPHQVQVVVLGVACLLAGCVLTLDVTSRAPLKSRVGVGSSMPIVPATRRTKVAGMLMVIGGLLVLVRPPIWSGLYHSPRHVSPISAAHIAATAMPPSALPTRPSDSSVVVAFARWVVSTDTAFLQWALVLVMLELMLGASQWLRPILTGMQPRSDHAGSSAAPPIASVDLLKTQSLGALPSVSLRWYRRIVVAISMSCALLAASWSIVYLPTSLHLQQHAPFGPPGEPSTGIPSRPTVVVTPDSDADDAALLILRGTVAYWTGGMYGAVLGIILLSTPLLLTTPTLSADRPSGTAMQAKHTAAAQKLFARAPGLLFVAVAMCPVLLFLVYLGSDTASTHQAKAQWHAMDGTEPFVDAAALHGLGGVLIFHVVCLFILAIVSRIQWGAADRARRILESPDVQSAQGGGVPRVDATTRAQIRSGIALSLRAWEALGRWNRISCVCAFVAGALLQFGVLGGTIFGLPVLVLFFALAVPVPSSMHQYARFLRVQVASSAGGDTESSDTNPTAPTFDDHTWTLAQAENQSLVQSHIRQSLWLPFLCVGVLAPSAITLYHLFVQPAMQGALANDATSSASLRIHRMFEDDPTNSAFTRMPSWADEAPYIVQLIVSAFTIDESAGGFGVAASSWIPYMTLVSWVLLLLPQAAILKLLTRSIASYDDDVDELNGDPSTIKTQWEAAVGRLPLALVALAAAPAGSVRLAALVTAVLGVFLAGAVWSDFENLLHYRRAAADRRRAVAAGLEN